MEVWLVCGVRGGVLGIVGWCGDGFFGLCWVWGGGVLGRGVGGSF